MGSSAESYPSAAFVLSLVGGILIILVGLFVAFVGALVTFFLFGLGGVVGLIGTFWGVLVVVMANMLRTRPAQHTTWGILIILFALFSFFGAFGGALLGFVLALVGGIMAIAWNPPTMMATAPMSPPIAGAMTPMASAMFCPNCGSAVEAGAKFCRACGKPL